MLQNAGLNYWGQAVLCEVYNGASSITQKSRVRLWKGRDLLRSAGLQTAA